MTNLYDYNRIPSRGPIRAIPTASDPKGNFPNTHQFANHISARPFTTGIDNKGIGKSSVPQLPPPYGSNPEDDALSLISSNATTAIY